MKLFANSSVFVVAILHIVIMCLEILPFECPVLLKNLEKELGFAAGQAKYAAPIVMNAGLFNGFLACGLIWSLTSRSNPIALRIFFLSFVAVAGIFGAMTLPSNKSLFIQSIPAAIAIFANVAARSDAESLKDETTEVDLDSVSE